MLINNSYLVLFIVAIFALNLIQLLFSAQISQLYFKKHKSNWVKKMSHFIQITPVRRCSRT